MKLSVTSAGESEDLRSLEDWLRRDPDLRGIRITPATPPPPPGQMGVLTDTLQLVSDNGELMTAVATTIGVWLGTRSKRTRIKVTDGDRSVEIDAGKLEDPEQVTRRILDELAGPGDDDEQD
jgi:hypothetical protein